jgi:hypothetical protein
MPPNYLQPDRGMRWSWIRPDLSGLLMLEAEPSRRARARGAPLLDRFASQKFVAIATV